MKAAATLGSRDSRGPRSLAADLGPDFGAGVILHIGHEALQLEPKWVLPLSALWSGAPW